MQKKLVIFAIGAAGYSCIEVAVRGYTHWSMALTGGACLLGLWRISRRFAARPLWVQAVCGGALITGIELAVGAVVNLWLGWRVWNYADQPINLWGQICPLFSLYWCGLSFLVCGAMRLLRRRARH